MDDEQIVLLDESFHPIGSAPKLASHHAQTPLHLAFSCYLFNTAGKLLLTKRADTKKVWPGVWTNSFCGHPLPGELLPAAIARRAQFELGIKELYAVQEVLDNYRYTTPPFNGIIENEFCPVFLARIKHSPQINPDEVETYRWVDLRTLSRKIDKNPDAYSYWLKEQLPLLAKTEIMQAFF